MYKKKKLNENSSYRLWNLQVLGGILTKLLPHFTPVEPWGERTMAQPSSRGTGFTSCCKYEINVIV